MQRREHSRKETSLYLESLQTQMSSSDKLEQKLRDAVRLDAAEPVRQAAVWAATAAPFNKRDRTLSVIKSIQP